MCHLTDGQVLCAIVIPSPIATTQWLIDMAKKDTSKLSGTKPERELDDINGQRVDDIVFSALTHPENEERAGKPT
jgi:hypothetical protein